MGVDLGDSVSYTMRGLGAMFFHIPLGIFFS